MRLALLLPLLLLPFTLLADEPSAFGAGNLDSDNPYGLTAAEKKILQNNKTLTQNKRKLNSHKSDIESLRERIDGLQSVLESIAMKSQNNKVALGDISKSRENEGVSTQERLVLLETQIATNGENIVQLKTAIEELSKLMDEQSASLVTKEEHNALVNDVNAFKVLVAGELKQKSKKSSSNMSSGDLATRAKKNYDKKNYTKALNDYKELVNRKYKPAYGHYMIAQCYFAKNDYGQAIAHYKESASRYKKASYMPTLMLRTAYSMEKTGDKNNAAKFYNAVIAKYPGSEEANKAERYLSKL
ncbi:MAG: tetratricopeptide repeat protein [Sulfurimonadaceae bacterium]